MNLSLGTFGEEICACVPVYIRKSGNFITELMFVSDGSRKLGLI